MEEYTVKFTKQEVNNLLIFLKRVNLTGEEVGEYINIINKLSQKENPMENTKTTSIPTKLEQVKKEKKRK